MKEQELVKKYLVFSCKSGSHAYGTSTPTSDIDIRGVFIAPPEYTLGCMKHVGEVTVEGTEDHEVHELAKFVKLAADCNPNIIELLYTGEENILLMHPAFEEIRKHRHLFLSKKAKFTFSGYAHQQLHRIKGHHKWINDPQGEDPPKLLDFAKVVWRRGGIAPGRDIAQFHNVFLVKVNATVFRIYSSPKFSKPILDDSGMNFQCVNISEDKLKERLEGAEFWGVLIGQVDTFRAAHKKWKEYWKWKKNRNPARAVLEEKYNFDCYSDDTEFLTELGWEKFDDIKEKTGLATLNPTTFRVEYQRYVERHEALYSGTMFNFSGHHTDINVSGNHRMFINKTERRSGKMSGWGFTPACMVPDSFLVINRIEPKQRTTMPSTPGNIDIRLYLKIIGWYVSEGSVAHRLSSGKPSVLSLSQLKGGRLHWKISRAISDFGDQIKINSYSHYRKSKNRTELTWTIPNRELAQEVVGQCGDKSKNKCLPRWVMGLSRRMQEILLDALHAGDGTDCRPHDARIYYTASPQLADDVQELAFFCGYETAKWGPYEGMYHIHINKQAKHFRRLIRNQNVEMTDVDRQRIVCFTVPNEILITRRNGKIGIQGNS
jgi:hypothetical protein